VRLGALTGLATHKGIPFEITQLTDSWKWTVFFDATRTQTGAALTRTDAVLAAEIAIDEMLKNVKRN